MIGHKTVAVKNSTRSLSQYVNQITRVINNERFTIIELIFDTTVGKIYDNF